MNGLDLILALWAIIATWQWIGWWSTAKDAVAVTEAAHENTAEALQGWQTTIDTLNQASDLLARINADIEAGKIVGLDTLPTIGKERWN